MIKQEMIPDGSGTVAVGGLESLADNYKLKEAYLKTVLEEVDRLKDMLRGAALGAIRTAREAGAVRAFIRASGRGGVLVTMPDYTKPANRPEFNAKKLEEMMKMGSLDSIGLSPEEVFEEERTPGGEVIELRGRWVEWFKSHYSGSLTNDPDLNWEKREPTVVRRVREAVIPRLEVAAAAGSAIAQLLITKGLKALMVKAEEK